MRRLAGVSSILAIGLLAGCGGAQTSPSSSVVIDPTSPTDTLAASASARPSAAGVGALCAEGRQSCPLEAGTYSSAPFEPEFTFSVDDEWTNDRAYAEAGAVSRENGALSWASGVTVGTVGGEDFLIGPTADEFVAFLQALEATAIDVSDPTPVTVADVSGQQVDVTTGPVDAGSLFFLDDDEFGLVADEKARFLVLDNEGEHLVFILESYVATDFDEWIETVTPVVESVTWTE